MIFTEIRKEVIHSFTMRPNFRGLLIISLSLLH
jgi:hypothetical protein